MDYKSYSDDESPEIHKMRQNMRQHRHIRRQQCLTYHNRIGKGGGEIDTVRAVDTGNTRRRQTTCPRSFMLNDQSKVVNARRTQTQGGITHDGDKRQRPPLNPKRGRYKREEKPPEGV